LLVPAMEAAWTRFGLRSFWALTAAAIVVDILYFVGGMRWLGFVNYLFVWGAISLLGYTWLDDRFSSRRMLLICAALALAVLLSLVLSGPIPSRWSATRPSRSATRPRQRSLSSRSRSCKAECCSRSKRRRGAGWPGGPRGRPPF